MGRGESRHGSWSVCTLAIFRESLEIPYGWRTGSGLAFCLFVCRYFLGWELMTNERRCRGCLMKALVTMSDGELSKGIRLFAVLHVLSRC